MYITLLESGHHPYLRMAILNQNHKYFNSSSNLPHEIPNRLPNFDAGNISSTVLQRSLRLFVVLVSAYMMPSRFQKSTLSMIFYFDGIAVALHVMISGSNCVGNDIL